VPLICSFNFAISRQTDQGYIPKFLKLEEKLFAIILKVTVI
jgi:hypothetical protein